MMIKINLLPPSQRKAFIPVDRIFIAIMITIFLVFAVVYIYGCVETASLEKQITADREAYRLLSQTIERKSAIEQNILLVEQKNEILLRLSKQNNSWHSILVHLGSIVPAKVWLDEVGINDKHELFIRGKYINFQSLSIFIHNFEQNTLLENPRLIVSERIEVDRNEYNITSFTILANFKEQK